MAKFFMFENADAGKELSDTLVEAGYGKYPRWTAMNKADFGLIDHEHSGNRPNLLLNFKQNGGTLFVYPHTPLAYFLWDGVYKTVPVDCNFVASSAAKMSMLSYGYPYRIETIGFSRCKVKSFTPTMGRKLLFVPARTRGSNSGYASNEYAETTQKAWEFVLKHVHNFEEVTVCYVNDFVNESDPSLSGIHFVKTYPRQSPTPTQDMVKWIDKADLVISCETVGCLSVARGKPTVFYNTDSAPVTSRRYAQSFEKYKKHYRFPLDVLSMTMDDILAVCEKENEKVEEWKSGNIGENFDAEKFLSIVQEYVS